MHCRRASELMVDRLDGCLDARTTAILEEHLAECEGCRTEWQRMCALDLLFRSAATVPAPNNLRPHIVARIVQQERTRLVVAGSLILALGATAVALLLLGPVSVWFFENLGIVPTLLAGGLQTLAQLLLLIETQGRVLVALLSHFAVPLTLLGLGTLAVTIALNALWIATLRRTRTAG